MSFFATGSSSLTGTSTSAGEPQRRPFWATTPVDEPKINDATVAASKAAPVDAVEPEKEKKPKKARAKKEPKAPKKAKETADSDESIVLPETDKDIWGTDYISRVVAAKNDIAIRKSKKIVDDIFETIADVRCIRKEMERCPIRPSKLRRWTLILARFFFPLGSFAKETSSYCPFW